MFERLAVAGGLQFLGMTQGAGRVKMLVAAAMIEMVVGVDDIVDVAGVESKIRQLPREGLRGILDRFLEGQHPHHMIEIIAGVEQVAPVCVFDQYAITRKAHLASGSAVPESMKPVDDQRPAVEQMNLRVCHESELLWLDFER